MRIEYEYKLMLQPQQLNEQLREVNSARDAAEHARDEATAELNMLKATAADQQEQFLADMEAQHAVATEQLEAAYDHRFAVCHQLKVFSMISEAIMATEHLNVLWCLLKSMPASGQAYQDLSLTLDSLECPSGQ